MNNKQLWYCPEWGIFYRNGKSAGWVENNNFVRLSYKGVTWSAHRLAYLFMGEPIPKEVDHINRNRQDNSWSNLRGVSARENSENRDSNNTFIGVSRDKNGWRCYTPTVLGKAKHLGRFNTHIAACYCRWSYENS